MADNIQTLRRDLAQVARKARLSSAVDDVDKIIDQLLQAREKIASEHDPHAASLILTRLQNPVKEGFEAVHNDLKAVSRTQKEFGKALDRSFPVTDLPTEHDAMGGHPALINRAIAMHLLREGHFGVARMFMDEAREMASVGAPDELAAPPNKNDMTDEDEGNGAANIAFGDDISDAYDDDDEPETAMQSIQTNAHTSNFTQKESLHLQDKFQSMYAILQDIKAHQLEPAINWARSNSEALEERGSNLEFELSKLQFIWLAKTQKAGHSSAEATMGALKAAIHYAKDHFERFRDRHLGEIQRLATSLVFASNAQESPYASVFETASAFEDVAATFTREFCSLLGLSAESPLYVAATAGSIALPRLIKFIGATRSRRTEWTTANELAFETPLPASMIYHSIFVCPVSKEQTTESNPPMRLPCGHVLAHDSLQNLAKGSKLKCPYCPVEGHLKDARQIIL